MTGTVQSMTCIGHCRGQKLLLAPSFKRVYQGKAKQENGMDLLTGAADAAVQACKLYESRRHVHRHNSDGYVCHVFAADTCPFAFWLAHWPVSFSQQSRLHASPPCVKAIRHCMVCSGILHVSNGRRQDCWVCAGGHWFNQFSGW